MNFALECGSDCFCHSLTFCPHFSALSLLLQQLDLCLLSLCLVIKTLALKLALCLLFKLRSLMARLHLLRPRADFNGQVDTLTQLGSGFFVSNFLPLNVHGRNNKIVGLKTKLWSDFPCVLSKDGLTNLNARIVVEIFECN